MRKLNVKFAIVLGLSVVFFAIAVHAVHILQSSNSADNLLVRARELKKEGNLRDSLKLYTVYLSLRKDDVESQVEAANIAADIAESPGRNQRDVSKALGHMEKTVRENPGESKLRRRLVSWKILFKQWSAAIDHLEQLGANAPDADPELKLQYSTCLLQTGTAKNRNKAVEILHAMVGFDAKDKSFDPKRAIVADNIAVYPRLASIYREYLNNPDMAIRFIDQMVKVNPKSSKARLVRAGDLMARGKKEEVRVEIEKALELDPENLNALLAMAQLDIQEKKFAEAQQRLDYAVNKNPENQAVYLRLEQLSTSQGDQNGARMWIEKGLAKIPQSQKLRWHLARHQLNAGETEEVKKTLKVLKETHFSQDLLDQLEARKTMIEGNVVAASREFERIRPLLSKYRQAIDLKFKTDQYLAACYAIMGQTDRQIEALRRVIPLSGNSPGPLLKLAKAYETLGTTDKASKIYLALRETLGDDYFKNLGLWRSEYALRIRQQSMQRNRDWTRLSGMITDAVEKGGMSADEEALERTDLDIRQEKFAEARTRLDAAIRSIEKDIADNKIEKSRHPLYGRALLQDVQLISQETDADKALERLAEIEKIFGDSVAIRLRRASLFVQRGAKDVSSELATLEAGIEDLNQDAICNGLARSYLQVRNFPEARRLFKKIRDRNPYNLKIRVSLLELVQQSGDTGEADEALGEIEKLCGKKSSTWRFYKAYRLLSQAMQTEDRVTLLDEASRLLREIEQGPRKQWHLRPLLQAEIARLEQKPDEAIKRLDEALQKGPAEPKSISLLTQLYTDKGQFKEALRTLSRLGSGQLTTELRRRKVQLETYGGNQETAYVEAKGLMDDLIQRKADRAGDHLWYAGVLKQLKRDDAAEISYRVAVEKAPENARVRLSLIRHLASLRKYLEASDAVREVELALPEDELPIVLADCYQIIGKRKLAEQLYQQALEAYPENVPLLKALALLNLTNKDQKSAETYFDRMIASKDDSSLGESSRAWARREKAKLIAARGDHQDFERALALIRQNYAGGKKPALADLDAEVTIYYARPEFTYKQLAIQKILDIRKKRRTLPNGMLLMLAKLYDSTDKWDDARNEMYLLVGRDGNNATNRTIFARMFIRHEEHKNAEVQLDLLDKLLPNSLAVLSLRAEADHASGNTDEAIKKIKKIVPPAQDDDSITEDKIRLLVSAAQIFERMDQPDLAEPLYRRYVAIRPNGILALAQFLARQGTGAKTDEALGICDEVFENIPLESVLAIGLTAVRSCRDDGTPVSREQMAHIERLFDRAVRENPESFVVQMRLGALRDLQSRYSDVLVIYRKLLSDKNLPPQLSAVVRNNLAFALVLSGGDKNEALTLMDEAIKHLGSQSDLLDTRGMVYWYRGTTDMAVKDLKDAVKFGANAAKHFHLALAYQADGNSADAVKELNKARQMKLDPKKMSAPEKKWYDSLVSAVEGITAR